eukprot:m.47277 g.47277  ORF g.47277 m.47277 type:complete len:128 (+) comp12619_c0_seq1:111-494(+)
MSGWDAYTSRLVESGAVTKAAIHGLDGNVWSTSPQFSMTQADTLKCIAAMNEGNPGGLSASGINAAGVRYICIRVEEDRVIGKKGDAGIIMCKGKSFVIVGTYISGMQPGNCMKVVSGMVEFLNQSL